jgi:hypothetical protein
MLVDLTAQNAQTKILVLLTNVKLTSILMEVLAKPVLPTVKSVLMVPPVLPV